jgi:hypothetical protein
MKSQNQPIHHEHCCCCCCCCCCFCQTAELFAKLLCNADREKHKKRMAEQKLVADEANEAVKRYKSMTSGQAFGAGHLALHKRGILEHQEKWLKEKQQKEQQQKCRRADCIRKKKEKVKKILHLKAGDDSKFTISELKLLCGYKKRRGDCSLATIKGPNARNDLLQLWNQWKGRNSPNVSDAEEDDDDDDNVIIMDSETVAEV